MSDITTEYRPGHFAPGVMELEAEDLARSSHWLRDLGELGLESQLQQAGERVKIFVATGEERDLWGDDKTRIVAAAVFSGYAALGMRTRLDLRVRPIVHLPKATPSPTENLEYRFAGMNTAYSAMRTWLREKYHSSVCILTSGVADNEETSDNPLSLAEPLSPMVEALRNDLNHHFYTYPIDGGETPQQRLTAKMVISSIEKTKAA